MDKRNRFWALFFLLLAVMSLIFLSSGLSGTAISEEWELFDLGSDDENRDAGGSAQSLVDRLPSVAFSLWRITFMLTVILVPIAFFFALFSPDIRQTLLDEIKRALPIIIWMGTLFYLLKRLRIENLAAVGPSASGINAPPDWITNPTPWVTFLLGVLLLTLVSSIGWLIWRRTRRSKLELIVEEAQAAIDEFQEGRNFRDTIIECYYRMCRVLLEQQQIERAKAMTPREFASRLRTTGLEGIEIQRLTRLFEAVRYGARSFGDAEQQEAIDCLTAVARQVR
jgi:hypothetical protein